MIAVLRITGKVKNKQTTNETLSRLKLEKKFTCRLVENDDQVRIGMIKAVQDSVVFGKISDELAKELTEKRGKEGKPVLFLHLNFEDV